MARILEAKENKIGYIDPDTYEWTKQQQNKDWKQNFAYAAILIAVATLYVTYGYLLVQKIKN